MARTTAQVKGDSLEDAVRMIEMVILGANPSQKDTPITIERKKIVIVQGVKHEIDIYITINNGKGYISTFIFECKNWQDKIDPKEIIAFAQKVKDVRAQKGYFIARRFTKYAIAQAKRDGIELLTAADVIDVLPPFLNDFCIRGNNIIGSDSAAQFFVITQDLEKEGYLPGYSSESFVKYGDEDLLLGKLVEKFQHEIVNEYTNQLPQSASDRKNLRYEKTKAIRFSPGELSIEGLECREIQLHVAWESRLIRPLITSKFDIKTRGRVITVATDDSPLGGSLQISFISTE